MSVGVVIVSHSATLARGVVEVAEQMAPGVPIAGAGGTDDGGIGTSLELVLRALDEADSGEGAVLLYDLGSAQMTAEMALEMLEPERRERVHLSDAALVTGALAAAAAAAGGGDLGEVVGALASLEAGAAPPTDRPAADEAEAAVVVVNPLGLHARPAAALVAALRGLDAEVQLSDVARTASGRSLLELLALSAEKGTTLRVGAAGPDAADAVRAVTELVEAGFGEMEGAAEAPPEQAAPERAEPGVLQGVGVAEGLALGRVVRLTLRLPDIPAEAVGDPDEERRRLSAARDAALAELRALSRRSAEGDIFAAQAELLEDPALSAAVEERLAQSAGAARALADAVEEQRSRLAALPGEVMAGRATDVVDAGRRVLTHLLGSTDEVEVPEGAIVLAEDLLPSQVPQIAGAGAGGLAVERSGPTAHAAILAGNLGLPTVVRLGTALRDVPDDATVVLDGAAGTLVVDPDEEATAEVRTRIAEEEAARVARLAAAHEPAVTADGVRIVVAANASSVAEARLATEHGAEGIGLLRTEVDFLDRLDVPTEDEQAGSIAAICRTLGAGLVIVRTLDVGGDKPAPALGLDPVRNGFLGIRGIRHSLAHPDLFHSQLRAILRVAADHEVAVLLPMVTDVSELRAARAAMDEAARQLADSGVRHGRPAQVGAMVEVPAAALGAAELFTEVDFLSIGSNDLTQYVLAADRTLDDVAYLHRPGHPAVMALVADVCRSAERAGGWVGVCGEMAGDPELAVRLCSLGVRELSMAPAAIPGVKAALRRARVVDVREQHGGASGR